MNIQIIPRLFVSAKVISVRSYVESKSKTNRYRPLEKDEHLQDIFCLKWHRVVNRGHQINFRNKMYNLDPGRFGKLAGKEITVNEYEGGEISAWYAGEKLDLKEAIPVRRKWKRTG